MRFAFLALLSLLPVALEAATLQRDVGPYHLNLGTTPSRSMAQGLVQPNSNGSLHGGFDLSHPSGWYLGQWSPSLGVLPGKRPELNHYLGYRAALSERLGVEFGTMRYSHPGYRHLDSQDLYAGLTLGERRFGLAFSDEPSRRDGTLLADLGTYTRLDLAVNLRYASHLLNTPTTLDNGAQVRVFNDWSLSLSRPWLGIDLNLSYSDSSLGGDACSAYSGQNTYCESAFSFEATRIF